MSPKYQFEIGDYVRSTYRSPWIAVVLGREARKDARPLYTLRILLDRNGAPMQKAVRSLHTTSDESWLKAYNPKSNEEREMLIYCGDPNSNRQGLPSASRIALRHLKGGTVWRDIEGTGWTVQEAWDDALRRDESENGSQRGGARSLSAPYQKAVSVRAPKKPSKVNVVKSQFEPGKVSKQFLIRTRWQGDGFPNSISQDRQFKARYDKQADVLAAAKELALKYGVELEIELTAYCVGNTRLATVTPENGQPGIWRFEKAAFRD